jgi:hypothetical protein
MAKKSKKEYKTELRDRVKAALKASYDPNSPRHKLDYWVDFNMAEKKKFDDELKSKGIDVE